MSAAEPTTSLLGHVLDGANEHPRQIRDGFVLAPAEADHLSRNLTAVLNAGAGVRTVTFALILVIVGCGLRRDHCDHRDRAERP